MVPCPAACGDRRTSIFRGDPDAPNGRTLEVIFFPWPAIDAGGFLLDVRVPKANLVRVAASGSRIGGSSTIMPASRLQDCFQCKDASRAGALLPYFTGGFPDLATSAELIRQAATLGAAAVEIGFPFSDSIADGPVIQGSFHHVLDRGHHLSDVFEFVSTVRPTVECALVAMVSMSIVYRAGLDVFMQRAASAGFDGVIVPDLPVDESTEAAAAAKKADLGYVGLVAPSSSVERRKAIARLSSGFVYYVAVQGTTGERASLPATLAPAVAELRQAGGLPVCVGFGVSTAEHVRAVCSVADGAIVGSAIVRRIADAVERGLERTTLIDSVSRFLSELMSGLGPPPP